MPSLRDIVYGIHGAWRLARLDRGAMVYFDRTVAGFWKSFFAAVIVVPGHVLIVLLELTNHESDAGALRLLLVLLCAYTISWTAFPLAAHHVCEAIGKPEAYIGYIVAFNWAQVIQMAVSLPVIGLTAMGILPAGVVRLSVTVWIVILAYKWFITRTALGVSARGAAGFVGLDILIDFVNKWTTLAMIR